MNTKIALLLLLVIVAVNAEVATKVEDAAKAVADAAADTVKKAADALNASDKPTPLCAAVMIVGAAVMGLFA